MVPGGCAPNQGISKDVAPRHFDWEVVSKTDDYAAILDLFSGVHRAMASLRQDRLYTRRFSRRLGKRSDGRSTLPSALSSTPGLSAGQASVYRNSGLQMLIRAYSPRRPAAGSAAYA